MTLQSFRCASRQSPRGYSEHSQKSWRLKIKGSSPVVVKVFYSRMLRGIRPEAGASSGQRCQPVANSPTDRSSVRMWVGLHAWIVWRTRCLKRSALVQRLRNLCTEGASCSHLPANSIASPLCSPLNGTKSQGSIDMTELRYTLSSPALLLAPRGRLKHTAGPQWYA